MSNTQHAFFLLALFASAVCSASVIAILIWKFGWGALILIGGAYAIYVGIMLSRDFIANARSVSRR